MDLSFSLPWLFPKKPPPLYKSPDPFKAKDPNAPTLHMQYISDVHLLAATHHTFNGYDQHVRDVIADPKSFEPDEHGLKKAGWFEGGPYAGLWPVSNGNPSGMYLVPLHPIAGGSGICEKFHVHDGPRIIDFITDEKSCVILRTTSPITITSDSRLLRMAFYNTELGCHEYNTIIPPLSKGTYRQVAGCKHSFHRIGAPDGRAYFMSMHPDEIIEMSASGLKRPDMQKQSKLLETECRLNPATTAITRQHGLLNLLEQHTYAADMIPELRAAGLTGEYYSREGIVLIAASKGVIISNATINEGFRAMSIRWPEGFTRVYDYLSDTPNTPVQVMHNRGLSQLFDMCVPSISRHKLATPPERFIDDPSQVFYDASRLTVGAVKSLPGFKAVQFKNTLQSGQRLVGDVPLSDYFKELDELRHALKNSARSQVYGRNAQDKEPVWLIDTFPHHIDLLSISISRKSQERHRENVGNFTGALKEGLRPMSGYCVT